ncbi:MAG: MGMT family protein [Candidatus Kerfeldbacteria bacterium]|nr:MGMT family protein [Candidatus Kerfeldbacteria bacterium]
MKIPERDFFQTVYRMVRRIPKGKVATYGQIAALCGSPRAARTVGWALNALPHDQSEKIPWQRVLNREGRISILHRSATKELQAELLRSEGVYVELRDGNYWVDLRAFGWRPRTRIA